MNLRKVFFAELVGTAFLLAIVVGSGIMGERLANGNVAIALLANSVATGAGLIALIIAFGAHSGAHFNPVVTFAEALLGKMAWRVTPVYILAQISGAFAGVAAAHFMFDLPAFSASEHFRTGPSQWFSEFVATFGLLTVILHGAQNRVTAVPYMVGAYITAAYWFTSSTSFANPAVTMARSVTNTFSGIYPAHAPAFIIAQFTGLTAALFFYKYQYKQ
ncbi:MAG: MIP/aquaporin family protein [Burkholderiales bacterium]